MPVRAAKPKRDHDEQIHIGPNGIKLIGKGPTGLLRGLGRSGGAALGRAFGPLAELVDLGTERARAARIRNFLTHLDPAIKDAEKAGYDLTKLLPKFFVPFVARASLETDPDMGRIWGELLQTEAASPNRLHIAFIEMLSALSSEDARLLAAIAGHPPENSSEVVALTSDDPDRVASVTARFMPRWKEQHSADVKSIAGELEELITPLHAAISYVEVKRGSAWHRFTNNAVQGHENLQAHQLLREKVVESNIFREEEWRVSLLVLTRLAVAFLIACDKAWKASVGDGGNHTHTHAV